MLLFVKDGCRFCDAVSKYDGVTKLRVKATGRGPKVDMQGTLIDLPPEVKGLPALLDGHQLFLGEAPILEHLKAVFGDKNA